MNHDDWLMSALPDSDSCPDPTDEQIERATDEVIERCSEDFLFAMRDEGFFEDYLRDVMLAKTPGAQALACEQMRGMFERMAVRKIDERAWEIAKSDHEVNRECAEIEAAEAAYEARMDR